ncbi:hypothetical protein JMJ35_002347 [Cladonia borealis]|uniref:Asl1-like glycosyl hydrolase catalytic domain-containing protein n=1 Tax=Cladonia borealis TaxID=184061 RepID=A0AA39R4Z3_9LECA|nr:hypothetical protein JMJ35_002347 [Cladonia borealis]
MAILNIALLSALLPSVLAIPGLHGRGMGHGPYIPSGKYVVPSGYPHPSGAPDQYHHHPSGAPIGTAPFPVQNATATGTGVSGGSGPVVTIQSTIQLVPIPVTNTVYSAGQSPESTGPAGAGGPGGVGSSPSASGVPGSGESGASGSAGSGPGGVGSSPTGAPGAPGAPGSGGEAGTCGPATVTITQAQTVTVTVPAGPSNGAPGSGPGESPGQSAAPSAPGSGPGESPGQSAAPGAPESAPSSAPTVVAPFPIGNSSASAGPSGSGSGVVGTGTGVPTYHHPVPLPAHSVAPVVNSPAAAPVVSSPPAPVEAAISAAPVTASSVPVEELYHAPGQNHHQPPPQQPSVSPTYPAPQAQASTTLAPAAPAPSSAAPAPSSSSSSTPVSSSGGVKARGLLYGSLSAAQSFDTSNIGWGWDWDSSPSPASGQATGSIGSIQFVPMLLSTESVHTSIWEGNSAGAEWVMGFNEPDQCGGGGSCMSVSDVVSGWGTYFSGMSASKCSPATTNDLTTQGKGLSYMTEFLAACTGCKFDALAFHYYGSGSDLSALTSTIQAYQKLQQQYNIPELWIPEMAPTDSPSSDEVTAMLAVLDNPANGVTRYAFNGLNTGSGVQLSGDVASAYCS